MKKILSLMVAALSLLALSSCMKENFSNGADEATMTLNISMPDAATKAYGDGMLEAKNVIIGVFDENGVEKFRKIYVWEKNVFQQEVTIQFVMGKTYQMVLWAQYGDAYGDPKTMSLDEITLDYKQSNREDLDAFYAYVEPFRVTADFSKSITLKRPFAQLNFATTVGDMDESIAAGDLGIHNMAAVTIKNVANTLNLFTGEATYIDENQKSENAGKAVIIPETAFPKVDGKYPTIEVEGTTYEVISMNYVLVADAGSQDGKTTVDLELKVGDLVIEVPGANMKRNWRTNVVGELLTGEGTFTVKIDPIFDGTYNENWNEGTGNETPEQPEQPELPEQPEPIVPAVALTLVSTEAVPAEGGNVVVKVTSNVAWTLALDGTKVTEGAEAVTDFEVIVPVAANTATEVANHTLLLSDVPAEGAQAVTATAQFTQAAAAPVTPEPEPDQPVLADGTYWIVSGTNYATPLTSNYGYIKVETAGYVDNAFKFTAVNGGYTIQDATGKYYYQTGTYNSFNVAAEMPAEGAVWTIAKNDDGSYVITNVSVNKSIQYDTEYNSYGSYAEVKGIYPSLVDAKAATERPAPEVPDQPEGDAVKYATNVTCTTVSSAYTDGVATVNGVADVFTLKLGTSKLNGEATITLPAGTTKVSYYAVGWKNTPAELQFSVGENVVGTQAIAANDGATGNAPYTMTVTDSDRYTITLDAALTADTLVTVKTLGTKYRAILFGIQAE